MRSKEEFEDEITRLQADHTHIEHLATSQELSSDALEEYRELLQKIKEQISHMKLGLKKSSASEKAQMNLHNNDLQDFAKLYTLEYDKERRLVILIWRSEVSSKQFRAINELMLALVQEHSAEKILDAIHFGLYISPEDREWSAHDFIPRLYRAGLRYGAVVVPQNTFTMEMIGDVVQKLNPDEIEIKYFSTIIRAKMWLARL